jgi:ABC-type branched-subunit amino acid transport system substrate-binding protein
MSPVPLTSRPRRKLTHLKAVAAFCSVALLTGCASASSGSTGGSDGPVHLKLGNIMPFTGDLSTFGAPLDAAAKLAATYINDTLKKSGLDGKYSVDMVESQDDQSANAPAVEAATKLATVDGVDGIVGTLGSGSTIAVAQAVTIPQGLLQVTPTASSPKIGQLQSDHQVFQLGPNDNFQARELVAAVAKAYGSSATVNVGWRNDDYGNPVSDVFMQLWKAQGGTVGQQLSWDPTAATFDEAARKLASGNPQAWVIFDFPTTFEKMGAALVRTGSWDPTKTFVSAEFRDQSALQKIGANAINGLRGVSPATGSTQLQDAFTTYFKTAEPSVSPTGYERFAFDSVITVFLAALKAHSTKGPQIGAQMGPVTNAPGTEYDYRQLGDAINATLAGQDIDYQGISGPIDLDDTGSPAAARYDVWSTTGNGTITTLETAEVK